MQIDTGAQVSCLPLHYITGKDRERIMPSNVGLESFNGGMIRTFGCILGNLQIGEITLNNCLFYIVEDNCSAILGTPELEENNICIDIGRKKITKDQITESIFTDGYAPSSSIKVIKKSAFYTTSAKTTQFTTIPPKSCVNVNLALEDQPSSIIFAIPEIILKNKNIEIYPQCVKINRFQQTITIKIGNNSVFPVSIPRNTCFCRFVEVDICVPETGKFEQIMSELQIGDAPEKIKAELKNIVMRNIDVFAVENEKLGTTDAMAYSIDTGTAAPVASQRYKTPYYLRQEMKKIIDDNLKSGLLEPISSPWAAPVLLVRKPSGKWRLVCDYRKLNAVTISNQYPLPDIDGLIDTMADSKIFSTADLFTGFHQIPCDEATKQKVAITTEFGQYTWTAMPMGGKNAPAVFQQMMDKIFCEIPKSTLAIYLDDICMHSKNYEDNLRAIEKVLKILKINNLKIRAAKTEFLMKKVKFCGALIENGKRSPNPSKTQAVRVLPEPTSKKEAASIFGLFNYFRNFIPQFASKAAPIAEAMGKTFKWDIKAKTAFENLKREIADYVDSLRIPNPNEGKFAIETDASENGLGAALLYKKFKGDNFEPVAFYSMRFDSAQKNYNISEKELLAGRKAMTKWAHYLLGRSFTWFTDNSCVKWAHRIKSQKAKIAKWLAEIGDFDFETILKPSKNMVISDCLSRNMEAITIKMIKKAEMSHLQQLDPTLCKIANFTKINRWPHFPDPEIAEFLKWREKISIGKNDEIGVNLPHFRIIPPKVMINDILTEYHDKSGHPGITQTLQEIEKKYFHPEMRKLVKEHIKTCFSCQIKKPNNNPIKVPLGKVEPPVQPYERFAVDLVGPLPMTDDCNRYICVSTDLFSKRVYAQPLNEKTAGHVLHAVKIDWYRNPHLPKSVLMDNGTEFSGLKRFCEDHGVNVKLSPAYHPQTNGEVENRNRTIKSRLRLLCDMENWDDHLPRIIHQINSAQHSVTKFSPFQIETGFSGENIADPYKTEQIKQECDFELIRSRILDNHKSRQKDEEIQHDFKEGDLVLAKSTYLFKKGDKYNGPFKIIKIKDQGLSFVLINLETGNQTTRHLSQIKRFFKRDNLPEDQKMPKSIQIQSHHRKKRRRRFKVGSPPLIPATPQIVEPNHPPSISGSEEPTSNSDVQSEISETTTSAAEENSTTSEETEIPPARSGTYKTCFSSSSEEEEMESIASSSTSHMTRREPPRKAISPVMHRICDLTDKALNEIIDKCKIQIKIPILKTQSNKKYKIEQITQWIRKNKPNWDKDEDGHFLAKFESLPLEKKRYINELSLAELSVLIKHLGIDLELHGRSRADIISAITTVVKKDFPEFKFTQGGMLIIDPKHFK